MIFAILLIACFSSNLTDCQVLNNVQPNGDCTISIDFNSSDPLSSCTIFMDEELNCAGALSIEGQSSKLSRIILTNLITANSITISTAYVSISNTLLNSPSITVNQNSTLRITSNSTLQSNKISCSGDLYFEKGSIIKTPEIEITEKGHVFSSSNNSSINNFKVEGILFINGYIKIPSITFINRPHLILNSNCWLSFITIQSSTILDINISSFCYQCKIDAIESSESSISFSNFFSNIIKLPLNFDLTKFSGTDFYQSNAGLLYRISKSAKVLTGFPESIVQNPSIATFNNDRTSVDISTIDLTSTTTFLRIDSLLECNMEYNLTLTYDLQTESSSNVHIFIRNRTFLTDEEDYGSYFLTIGTKTTSTYSFFTDERAKVYSIYVTISSGLKGTISSFELTKVSEIIYSHVSEPYEYYDGIDEETLPKGATEFEVKLPQNDENNTKIINAADFGLNENIENASDIINEAINYCKTINVTKLIINKGIYKSFTTTTISISELNNFTIDGSGATIIFDADLTKSGSARISVKRCNQLLIQNLNADWNWDRNPLASLVKVLAKTSNTFDLEFVEYDEYPLKDINVEHLEILNINASWVPPIVKTSNNKIKSENLKRKLNSNTRFEWLSPNSIRIYDYTYFLVNQYLRLQHSYYQYGCFSFDSNTHLTLRNINVYSCSGHAFSVTGSQQYWHFDNVNIVKPKDKTKRHITCTADHCHCYGSKGYFLMENCEFSFGTDDCLNFHDNTLYLTKYSSNSLKTISGNYLHLIAVGQTIELRYEDFSPTNIITKITDRKVIDQSNGIYEVILNTTIPGDIDDGFITFNQAFYSHNLIVRNCSFHNTTCRGILIQGDDVTIENSHFYNIDQGAIKILTGFTLNSWCEGYGVNNVRISNCTFYQCNENNAKSPDQKFARDIEIATYSKVDPSALQTRYPILRNILFENNTFSNTYGLIAWIASVENVTFRNNIIHNDKKCYNAFDYRGSFYIDVANNIRIVNNVYIPLNNNSSFKVKMGVTFTEVKAKNVITEGNRVGFYETNINDEEKESNTALIAGCVVCGVIAVVAISIMIAILIKRKKENENLE